MDEREDYDKTFTPSAHKTSHQDGGTDEISVEGLAGELTAEQKSAWNKVSGKPTTFAPSTHKTNHQDGGTDEISVEGLAGVLTEDQHAKDTEVEAVVTGRQKARAYRGNAQAIPSGEVTKILIDTDSFDPDNITDLTNHRITPTKAGYYICIGNVGFNHGVDGAMINIILAKSGSYNVFSCLQPAITGTIPVGGMVSDIIYFNGSTDYLELYVQHYFGINGNLGIAAQQNFLEVLGPF